MTNVRRTGIMNLNGRTSWTDHSGRLLHMNHQASMGADAATAGTASACVASFLDEAAGLRQKERRHDVTKKYLCAIWLSRTTQAARYTKALCSR
jgi:hypothetical protein